MSDRCGRCRRILKDKESQRQGYGPRCRELIGAEQEAGEYQPTLFDFQPLPFKGNVIFKREGGQPVTNVPHDGGIDWGHKGEAVTNLARSILLLFTDHEKVEALCQRFTETFLLRMPYSGGTILGNVIKKWLREAI